MHQIGSSGARRHQRIAAGPGQRRPHFGIQDDPKSFGTDDDLDLAIDVLRADIELPAADQRIACNQGKIEQHLDRRLRQGGILDQPAELDLVAIAEQALDRSTGFAGVDGFAKPAGRTERQPEKLQLVGGRLGAVCKQFETARPHFRIMLVRKQFEAVVQRPNGAEQIVAQARTQQAGEIGRANGQRLGSNFALLWRSTVRAASCTSERLIEMSGARRPLTRRRTDAASRTTASARRSAGS